MVDLDEKIKEAEEKLKETPVNKATEQERARIKAKIAKLKEQKEKREKSGGGQGGYSVKKRGDATISLVGLPSTGKSTLLTKLTNAESEVANYEFTTLDVVPGIMEYKGAQFQILDVPGLIGGAAEGKGRGKEVLSVIRNSDMVIFLADKEKFDSLDRIEHELYRAGIRINQQEPDIKISREPSGGIQISKLKQVDLEDETIEQVLKDNGYINCKIIIREDVDLDRLIDGIMENRVYLPGFTVFNKIDKLSSEEFQQIRKEHPNYVFISAEKEENLNELREKIWNKLDLMRVYMKRRGKEPDKDEPLIIERESTVESVCEKIHDDFKDNLKQARIWGPSAKFPGQKVGGDHVLQDEDVLELNFK